MVDDSEVLGLGCDVGEAAAAGVVVALVLVTDFLEVGGDGEFLVPGTGPDVGEAAGGEEGRYFGLDVAGSADGGYVWTGGGELGLEFRGVLAVVGEAEVARS